jgi:putative hydrolase of the HAD superfamily
MDKNSWKLIKGFLSELEPLNPIETEIKPDYRKDPALKACIFDIYGTLLISASGDIDQAEFNTGSLEYAMNKSNITVNATDPSQKKQIFSGLLNDLIQAIQDEHEFYRTNGVPFPEVVIQDIWNALLEDYDKKGKINYTEQSDLEVYTILFELLSNKVYPMPFMREVVEKLDEKRIPLGIISNAQFYTPIIMNYFFEEETYDSENIHHFDPDLTIYSYKTGISKPDFSLFDAIKGILLEKYSISAEETLFVGNDLYKDIYPAAKTGFKTALFAGDKRSLRLREGQEEINNIKPGYIVKDLRNVLEILA